VILSLSLSRARARSLSLYPRLRSLHDKLALRSAVLRASNIGTQQGPEGPGSLRVRRSRALSRLGEAEEEEEEGGVGGGEGEDGP